MPLFDDVDEKKYQVKAPSLPGTGSDQEIVIRKMGMPITVDFAGETINLKPGSAYTLNIVQSIVMEAKKKVFEEWNRTDEGRQLIKLATSKQADESKLVQLYQQLDQTRAKVSEINLKYMIKAVQLIVLDAKDPSWKHKYNGIPPKAELEKAISSEKLLKDVSISEINTLFDIYFQLNDLSTARENFDKLGGMMP